MAKFLPVYEINNRAHIQPARVAARYIGARAAKRRYERTMSSAKYLWLCHKCYVAPSFSFWGDEK